MQLLELQHLKKYFASQKAVDDISLSIGKVNSFWMRGSNGASKTTLLWMTTGFFYPDSGYVIFDGKPFDPSDDFMSIGYMPE